MNAEMVPIDHVAYDPQFMPRKQIDVMVTVRRYVQVLRSDDAFEFPPANVVKAVAKPYRFMALDGVHRRIAYEQAGRERMPVLVEAIPESQWFKRAVELNLLHGLPYQIEDRTNIVRRLEEDGWAVDRISKLLKMTADDVRPLTKKGGGDIRPLIVFASRTPTLPRHYAHGGAGIIPTATHTTTSASSQVTGKTTSRHAGGQPKPTPNPTATILLDAVSTAEKLAGILSDADLVLPSKEQHLVHLNQIIELLQESLLGIAARSSA